MTIGELIPGGVVFIAAVVAEFLWGCIPPLQAPEIPTTDLRVVGWIPDPVYWD